MAKPLKFHQTLNQAPRSAKHGQHRRTSPPAHGHSTGEPSDSTGWSDQSGTVTVTWSTINSITSLIADTGEPKPPALPYAGIRAGEIIGHRIWWLIDGHLCSLAHRRLWTPGEVLYGNVNEPVPQWWDYGHLLFCGIYAFRDRGSLEPEIQSHLTEIAKWQARARQTIWIGIDWIPYSETRTFIVGTIKMWGEVIEHERGYRAEFAKLNSIDAAYGPVAVSLDVLRERYGVAPLSFEERTDG